MTPGRPTVRSGLRSSDKPTARVLMWRMDAPPAVGTTFFGALEDGTVFQKLGHQRWSTVMGPGDVDESFELVVEMTRRCEDRMGMVGPVEFSVEEALAGNIRLDVMWDSTERILMIGFDMALKAGRL